MSEIPPLGTRLTDRRLDNGLRLVLLPLHDIPLVAVNLWYHVGSKNDPPGLTGMAHLFEHMLFQGSQHVDTNGHFRHVQQVGGSANGSTSFDRTNYYETLPAHCLELGLWLESDRMGFLLPALDGDKLESQRSVVINERRQRIDNQPYGRAFETLQLAAFGAGHPYSWPIIGHSEDLERPTLDDVRTFFSTFYAPDNAVLTLVGDFEVAAAEDLVDKYFGGLPASGSASRVEPPPPSPGHDRVELADDVALSRVYLAWPAPPFRHPDRATGELLAAWLATGKSSPLYQALVHRTQLAQDVSAFLLPLELCSLFVLAATARPGVEPRRIEAALLEPVAEAAASAAGPEFQRSQKQMLAGIFQELETVESLADLLSQLAVLGPGPAAIDDEVRRYGELVPEEVSAFARRYLESRPPARLHVVPRQVRNA